MKVLRAGSGYGNNGPYVAFECLVSRARKDWQDKPGRRYAEESAMGFGREVEAERRQTLHGSTWMPLPFVHSGLICAARSIRTPTQMVIGDSWVLRMVRFPPVH